MNLTVDQAIEKARKLALLKKPDEAEALLQSVLKVAPQNKSAKKQMAALRKLAVLPDDQRQKLMQTYQQGDHAKSVDAAQTLQRQYPNTALLFLIEGAAQAQLGEHGLAERAFRGAVQIDPKSFQGYNNLGNCLKEQGQFTPARQAFLTAIKLNPKFAQAYNNLGILLKDQKKFPQAIHRLTQAISADPNYRDAVKNLGVVYQEVGDHKLAIAKFNDALKLTPNDPEVLSCIAQSYRAREQFKDAVKTLERVLAHHPNRIEQRQQLALSYGDLGRHDDAIAALEMVVAAKPEDLVALINLGNAISKTADLDRAKIVIERVLTIDPNNLGALNNLGVLLQNQGDLMGAAVVFDRALAIDPTVSELKMNRSVVHFLQSEYRAAWPLYLSRFEHENPSTPFLQSDRPVWAGENTRLFVWAEQGIGDEVFFASLLSEAAGMVETMIVSCDKRLRDMFERSFQNITFVDRGAKVSPDRYDAHIPIASLGNILRTSKQAFEKQPKNFLSADQARVDAMRNELPAFEGQTIGISWNTQNRKNNHVRNIDLLMFMQAFNTPNRRFVNLQYGDTDQEVAKVRQKTGADIITLDFDRFNDIEGLCAAMSVCDCVVTIDNSTVHLAAAMGVQTHLILAFFPDWRWPFCKNGSPWYPALNLYRQTSRFGWASVLDTVNKQI